MKSYHYSSFSIIVFIIVFFSILSSCTSAPISDDMSTDRSSNTNKSVDVTNSNSANNTNSNSANNTNSNSANTTAPWLYFIGNSLTPGIPERLDRLVRNNGGYPNGYNGYESHLVGAANLAGRVSQRANSQVIMRILHKKPRYIVLQEQSAGTSTLGFGNDTCNQIPQYLAIAQASNSELIIYQTWHGSNPEDFLQISKDYQLAMAPNGYIWRSLDNGNNLLLADIVHQNALGSSLYAASFFYLLNPNVAKIPNLIAQTGHSLSASDDNRYNQVVYDTVRNSSYSTTLRGVARYSNMYNGLKRCGLNSQNPPDLITGIDNEGNSLDSPIIITNAFQPIDVDIKSFDIDIYQLPSSLASKNIKVTFTNAFETLGSTRQQINQPIAHSRWKNSLFLGDTNGRAISYTLNESAIQFTVPEVKSYIGFIGGGIQAHDAGKTRPDEEGRFTITISIH